MRKFLKIGLLTSLASLTAFADDSIGTTAKTAIEAGQADLVLVMGAIVTAFLALWTGKQVLRLIK